MYEKYRNGLFYRVCGAMHIKIANNQRQVYVSLMKSNILVKRDHKAT